MQRLVARLLLLFALVGNVLPLALAATAALPHACCIRKAHRCHSSIADSNQLVLRSTGCCNHSCCRAVTTTHWAMAQPAHTDISAQNVAARDADSHPVVPSRELLSAQSTRAPPAC